MDMDKERLHQEDLQRIRGFRLIDDDFMNACFDNNIEATELILRIILGRDDILVKSVKTQKLMKNRLAGTSGSTSTPWTAKTANSILKYRGRIAARAGNAQGIIPASLTHTY